MTETVNARQQHEIAGAPETCRLALRRAYEGAASPRAAIKAFCLYCTGYQRADIRDCTSTACPLHAYRPFQSDEAEVEPEGQP